MTRTIWKFPVNLGATEAKIPEGSEFLLVDTVNGDLAAWFLVDSDAPLVTHKLRIFGTGHTIDDGYGYLGSVIPGGGPFVWHLFEAQ